MPSNSRCQRRRTSIVGGLPKGEIIQEPCHVSCVAVCRSIMRVESSAMSGGNINRAKTLSRLRTAAATEKNLLKLAAIAAKILQLAKQKQPDLLPQLAQRIKRLRKSLKLSQSQFGSRLNCSAMAVCRWERGQRPPSSCLLAMGKIAGPPGGWYFWNIAGITIEDVRAMRDRHH
jgi:DNA-binding transcriptional regulator YiaG